MNTAKLDYPIAVTSLIVGAFIIVSSALTVSHFVVNWLLAY